MLPDIRTAIVPIFALAGRRGRGSRPTRGRSSSCASRSVFPGMDNEHLSAEDVAAYIDGKVSDVERGRIQAHLIQCQRCFVELIELLHHLRPGGSRRPH